MATHVDKVKEDDKIVFTLNGKKYHYIVRPTYIYCPAYTNAKIFYELGVHKHSFCTDAYGYNAGDGECPTYNHGDFEAAKRLINALYVKCEEYELIKEAKRLYPVGTRFRPAHITSSKMYCTITDDSDFVFSAGDIISTIPDGQYSRDGDLKYGDGNDYHRWIYYGGKWAQVLTSSPPSPDPVSYIPKYKVGDVVNLIKPFKSVQTGLQVITNVTSRGYNIKSYEGGNNWAGEFPEELFEPYIDKPKEGIPTSKYNIGDEVKVCSSGKCNGYGYYEGGCYEYIQYVGDTIGKISSTWYSTERKEWYYNINSLDSDNSFIAEHALSLYSKVDDKARKKENLEKLYPPGTIFVPFYDHSGNTCDPVTVEKDWKIFVDDDEKCWFTSPSGGAVHLGYLCVKDKFAQKLPHNTTTVDGFKLGDIVGISSASEYRYQGMYRDRFMSGKVVEVASGGSYAYTVKWANGDSNCYKCKDLIKWEGPETSFINPEDLIIVDCVPKFTKDEPMKDKKSDIISVKQLSFTRI